MIQIDDWVVIATILAFFLAALGYLIYFIISRKLFPMVMEFQKEIEPNKATTVLSVDGSGVVKKVEMQVTENDNSWIDIVVDGASYTNFVVTREPNNIGKIRVNDQKDRLLNLEVNLDSKFHKNFLLLIHNRTEGALNSKGKVYYEIKNPLKVTLKVIYKETTS
jgi:hypothetical protein